LIEGEKGSTGEKGTRGEKGQKGMPGACDTQVETETAMYRMNKLCSECRVRTIVNAVPKITQSEVVSL